MKVLSLFDGISVARYALELLGHRDLEYYASEIDVYCRKIAHKNFPDTVSMGGVHIITKERRPELFDGSVALLIGGSPCQDLSIAKSGRKGLKGSRSNLFWEYVRILREAKPKYFVLENVASMPKEDRATITRELGVEPIMIDAALVSAQNRKRLFWTNIPGVTQPKDRGILLSDILESGAGPDKAHTLTATDAKGTNERGFFLKGHRNLVFANNEVYQYRRSYWRKTKGGKVPTLTANMGTGGNNVPYVKLERPVTKRIGGWREDKDKVIAYNRDRKSSTISEHVYHKPRSKTYAVTLVNRLKVATIDGKYFRPLSVVECERLQSLPDNYTAGVSNLHRYETIGNAFNAEVVKHILSFIKLKGSKRTHD